MSAESIGKMIFPSLAGPPNVLPALLETLRTRPAKTLQRGVVPPIRELESEIQNGSPGY